MSIRREDGAYASLLEHEQEQGIINHSPGQVSNAVTAGRKSARSGIRGCLGRQPYGKVHTKFQLFSDLRFNGMCHQI